MGDFLETECKNLGEFVERVKEKIWVEDWAKATGEKLHMNPHMVKKEEEATEEVAEEKKEEETKGEETREEVKEEETKEEDAEIKRIRGGTLARIRGAFDLKRFASAKKE